MAYKESSKLKKVQKKGYIIAGEFKRLTKYFSVQNGEEFCIVYNRTSIELNAALWAPHF